VLTTGTAKQTSLFDISGLRNVKGQFDSQLNPLDSKGNNSATSNNTKLVHLPMMGGLLHLVQRGGAWGDAAPPSPLLAVPNLTAHPSTASVLITVLLYDGKWLCSFNTGIKGLMARSQYHYTYSECLSATEVNTYIVTCSLRMIRMFTIQLRRRSNEAEKLFKPLSAKIG